MSGDLPPPSEQRWLLECLGELIQARGYERFLESPLRMASSEHFPDEWTPDADGVRTMLRRLLRYADLGMYEISLELTGTPNPVMLIQKSGGSALHIAAWFAGMDGRTIRFGCNRAYLHEPERLAAILSHEVAHAYRHHHGLDGEGSEEESLTDLTTVFLGFGVLTTNNAGMAEGTLSARRSVGTRDKGYLSALEMAFLLAAQAVAREADRRAIAEKLYSSQRRYFLAACKHLARSKAAMLEQLHVPLEVVSAAKLFNAGKLVYPVRSRLTPAVVAGAVLLVAGGGLLGSTLPFAVAGAVVTAGALALGLAWWRLPRYRCSHPDCRKPIRLDDLVCGNCGGQVAGALDRLRGSN